MVKQVVRKNRKDAQLKKSKDKRKRKCVNKKKKCHAKFGTSKLEQDFARDFLDKNGINYIWQFEAKDIQRFYDFYLPDSNILLEIDGDYYHVNPKKFDRDNWDSLTPTQKKDMMVDKIKDRWALLHGIPIYRFWEDDIRHNPTEVKKQLDEIIKIRKGEKLLEDKKNKRHKNKLK